MVVVVVLVDNDDDAGLAIEGRRARRESTRCTFRHNDKVSANICRG